MDWQLPSHSTFLSSFQILTPYFNLCFISDVYIAFITFYFSLKQALEAVYPNNVDFLGGGGQ